MLALALAAVLSGCGADTEAAEEQSGRPSAPATAAPTSLPSAGAGAAQGLDIQYLGQDGTIKILRVEDFPH